MKNYLLVLAIVMAGCTQKVNFKSLPKIDAHVHIETSDNSIVKVLEENNFTLLTLAYDASSEKNIRRQLNYSEELHKDFPKSISFATSFSMEGFGEKDWQEKTIKFLKESFDKGAIAVKVWKDIGMVFLDKDSSFIMMDDVRLDPIWDYIELQNKTLVNHTAEPRNCWLPIDSMTVKGDMEYYSEHPQYHMYLHPEYPSYQEILAARDRMLKKHPNLRYVGCHLGSMEWSVDVQAQWLDKFPKAAFDMASRIEHFKIQDSKKVRDFIIKYQDRLLYATDEEVVENPTSLSGTKQIEDILNNIWLKDWEYFTTEKTIKGTDSDYKCLNLPMSVLEKIYYKNAIRMYPGLK